MRNYRLKRYMPIAILVAVAVSLIAAILVFVASVTSEAPYQQVIYRIIGVLLLVMVALLIYLLYVSRDNDPHFFLYITSTQKNMPLEQLTFTQVNERMTMFLELLSDQPGMIWTDGFLENNHRYLAKEAYRPLVAYKMLYDLTVENTEEDWAQLEYASEDTVELVAYALQTAGETELPETLMELHKKATDRDGCENLRDFLYTNQKYLRGRMLRYVKQNWEVLY
ncbi:MAG: hypothetical protein IJW40_08925 [Clostridia bacterium]|nr:hypothetical protein [Clostridia bacterium]